MSNQGHRPPDGQARRSQILLGSGPGALVDLVDDAVVVGGLDAWRYQREHEGFIAEPRLQARVQGLLSRMPWWPHSDVRLRLPPDCDGDQPTPAVGVPVARFPKWFVCQNQDCRSLVNLKALKSGKHNCSYIKKTSYPVVPVRFVAACPHGHVQDIDWQWFVHRERQGDVQMDGSKAWCKRVPGGCGPNDPLGEDWTSSLKLLSVGTSGDLSDLVVQCRKCGAQRGLQDLARQGVLGTCGGQRPWLGYAARESCAEDLKLLTRTASNAYFPSPVSVLSIPDPALALRRAVEQVWDFVKVATLDTLGVFRLLPNVRDVLDPFADADVVAEIDRRRRGLPVETPPIRETEWRALTAVPLESPGDHPAPGARWYARRIDATLPPFLERIVLVKHLTEVRTQVGFTRLDAIPGDAEGDYSLGVSTAPLGLHVDWLPAVEILGEGVFLAFDGDALDEWADRDEVKARAAQFVRGARKLNELRTTPFLFPGVRLVLLHTLAHLLINSISLECGYAAASIRERLYCATRRDEKGEEKTTRAGILLYTGSPGSEGTLGGLVEIGRNILHHLRRAAEMAMLCSNDPVCAQHSPDDDQEGRHREGAACHGCVLIGEPSCERMNQDLDRTLVVPTVENANAAFLAKWIASWT